MRNRKIPDMEEDVIVDQQPEKIQKSSKVQKLNKIKKYKKS